MRRPPTGGEREGIDMADAQAVRRARDSLGEIEVPADAYFGAQTQRAIENFPVSGLRFPRRFIRAQGLVKLAAARANAGLGLIPEERARAIEQAAREVAEGAHDDQFRIDVYQAGAGTSQNMNANEVIAGRAAELLGGSRADPAASGVHPNDVVNMAQSTNDTIHVVIHVALAEAITGDVLPALAELEGALAAKAEAFDDIVKSGRTHLQDAVPIRLGQEFSGYAGAVAIGREALASALPALLEVGMGGTAVGTGLNAHPEFGARAVAELARETGLKFRLPRSMFAFMQNLDAVLVASGAMRAVAVSLGKLANDLRLLSSGPRNGLNEIVLPSLQPGSSIMPGKVNPVMAEMLNMVAYQVLGHDQTVAAAVGGAQLELNVMMPVIGYNALMAAQILAGGVRAFTARCVVGITANRAACEATIERSTAMVTALNPVIGYDRAAAVAKRAFAEGRTVRELLIADGILSEAEARRVLDVRAMTEPGAHG
jgi:fumarate hydratase class II